MEDVQRICVDFDYEEDKIDDYLRTFEVEEKYKGIPAYEWHETKSREQKAHERKLQRLEAERKQRREQRQQQIREEKERRRVEKDRLREERK